MEWERIMDRNLATGKMLALINNGPPKTKVPKAAHRLKQHVIGMAVWRTVLVSVRVQVLAAAKPQIGDDAYE
jgi:hypothetical protein